MNRSTFLVGYFGFTTGWIVIDAYGFNIGSFLLGIAVCIPAVIISDYIKPDGDQ